MKRLIVLVLCLCSVSSFTILPVQNIPSSLKDYETSTVGATETVVYTNVPTSSSAPDEIVVISNSTTSTFSDSVTTSTAPDEVPITETILNLKESTDLTSLSYSTTDSTNLQEPVTVLTSFDTKSLPESATETATILANQDATTTEHSYSASEPESTNDLTSLAVANFTSPSESANLSKTEKASTNLSDSVSITESAKTSTSSPDLSNSSNSTTSPADVTATSIQSDFTTDAYSLELTTEDLSFLSLELLPPKTEYRKNEPDPRYDY